MSVKMIFQAALRGEQLVLQPFSIWPRSRYLASAPGCALQQVVVVGPKERRMSMKNTSNSGSGATLR